MAQVILEGYNLILGRCKVGTGSVIGLFTILGYPSFSKVKGLLSNSRNFSIDSLDSVSEGTEVGSRCIIRSHTIIYERVKLGDNVQTGHHVLIREDTVVGERSVIGSNTVIDGRVSIGSHVSIQSNNYIPPGTVIGNDVFIGPGVVVTNDRYPPSK